MTQSLRIIAALVLALALVGGTVFFNATRSSGQKDPEPAAGPVGAAPLDLTPGESANVVRTSATPNTRDDAGRDRPPAESGSANPAPAVKDVTFDEVKLEMKKGDPYDASLLTPKVKQLDGKPIRIRGYILPSFQQTGIKQFVLVRDNMECCFGPGALLHDCILVEMTAPATATFSVRPVSVEGTFSIREVKFDGKYLAIYHLDGKEVK